MKPTTIAADNFESSSYLILAKDNEENTDSNLTFCTVYYANLSDFYDMFLWFMWTILDQLHLLRYMEHSIVPC